MIISFFFKKKKSTFPNVGVDDTLAISNVALSPTLANVNIKKEILKTHLLTCLI
jgi:hypothetical protein